MLYFYTKCHTQDWGQPKKSEGQREGLSKPKPDDSAVAEILKMEPKVECTGDSMKLHVQDSASIPGSLFFVDRGKYQGLKSHLHLKLLFMFFR